MALSYDIERDTMLPLAERQVHTPEAQIQRRWRSLIIGALVMADTAMLLLTFVCAYILRFEVFGFLYVPKGSVLTFYSVLVFWMIPVWLTLFAVHNLYDLPTLSSTTTEIKRIISSCCYAIFGLLILSFFLDDKLIISRAWLLMVWAISVGAVLGGRYAMRWGLTMLRSKGIARTRVLIVGTNQEAQQVAAQLTDMGKRLDVEIVGFVGERRAPTRMKSDETGQVWRRGTPDNDRAVLRWLGQVRNVRQVVDQTQSDEVLIASTALDNEELFDVVHNLTTSPVAIRLSPSLYTILTTGLSVHEVNGIPLVTVNKVRIIGVSALLKRSLDIVVSAGVLLVLLPVLLVLMLMVRLDSPGTIFYRRRVVGQSGKLFDAYKLRTMRTDGNAILAADAGLREELLQNGKLKNDPRVTRLGRFLRRSSLDELPQLWNVLRGQMSLVGPRMIIYEEMPRFGRWQSNLVTVKPGLTGLWQVCGRSNLTYADRVRLDMQYIRNYTLLSDIRILLRTIPAVVRGSGAY